MHPHESLIHQFYQAFKNKDYTTMQQCYAESAQFSDPVFQHLNAKEVRAMWEMLIKKGQDLELEYRNVIANDRSGSAEWTARYTFSTTGKRVTNKIKADFTFAEGKIVVHTDTFNFYRWASQALGISGTLLGWTAFLKNKVRKTARKSLENLIRKG